MVELVEDCGWAFVGCDGERSNHGVTLTGDPVHLIVHVAEQVQDVLAMPTRPSRRPSPWRATGSATTPPGFVDIASIRVEALDRDADDDFPLLLDDACRRRSTSRRSGPTTTTSPPPPPTPSPAHSPAPSSPTAPPPSPAAQHPQAQHPGQADQRRRARLSPASPPTAASSSRRSIPPSDADLSGATRRRLTARPGSSLRRIPFCCSVEAKDPHGVVLLQTDPNCLGFRPVWDAAAHG